MNVRHIKISDYNYPLPDERIAKFPLPQRDSSKLLVYNRGKIQEDTFRNIAGYLPEGAMMVFNNTKVIQARMHFRKDTGALIEIFLLEPYAPADYEQMFQTTDECSWLCIVGNLKKWKGQELKRDICVKGKGITLKAIYEEERHTSHLVRFSWNDRTVSFAEIIDAAGELPIPPYLNRDTQESDKTTYQTVYSKIKGSVAAPTAGLHFTDDVLSALDAHGIDREEITLHVGAGTFRPVKSAEIGGHDMHSEYICVHRSTLEKLVSHGCKTIAVGTTSVRTLESLYYLGIKLHNDKGISENELHVDQWEPYDETLPQLTPDESIASILDYMAERKISTIHFSTQIIIVPGYDYKIVNMLVTNFHQPQSTLLLLVSAFVNGDWKSIYDYALSHGFRFLSYGDSSLLIP